MTSFELRSVGSEPYRASAEQFAWGLPSDPSGTVQSDVDAWLSELGPVADAAIDLVRVAAAAYMADRQTPRREGYSRTIQVHVQVTSLDRWSVAVDQVTSFLHWLTADTWEISLSEDHGVRPEPADRAQASYRQVVLLSGGLDSFAGIMAGSGDDDRLCVGHWDNPTVKASQDRVWRWIRDGEYVRGDYRQVRLCERKSKRESSTRSRCFMFFALAAAAATANGVREVEIPENGFTSLNPVLGNDRGGALSTRSTHPWTINLFQELLETLGIDVRVRNPYGMLTKGELVALINERPTIEAGIALTYSCGKLDGHYYRGGNQNYQCGLCVACLTRRGAMMASGVRDETPYLLNTLEDAEVAKLLDRRKLDLHAVAGSASRDIDEFTLLAQGPFPSTYDLASAADLCRRGLAELVRALPS